MTPDVTITISTAGDGTSDARGPSPGLSPEAATGSLAGSAHGPIPVPLDELPGGTSARTTDPAAAGGLPVPGDLDAVGDRVGSAPVPLDLDVMTAIRAGLPSPEDLDAMAVAAARPQASRRRTRKSTGG
jgi:hypothetical protein